MVTKNVNNKMKKPSHRADVERLTMNFTVADLTYLIKRNWHKKCLQILCLDRTATISLGSGNGDIKHTVHLITDCPK